MFENPDALVAGRLRKVAALRALGIDPYPVEAYSPISISSVRADAASLAASSSSVRVAGRLVAYRDMGKLLFLDLLDDGTKLQAVAHRRDVGEIQWQVFRLLELGDIIGVDGLVFYTKAGEPSVAAERITVLGKATHPVPLPKRQGDKVFDAVSRRNLLHRHRHLDLLCNRASRETFIARARIVRGIRQYLDDEGFLEVETPVLDHAYGGAAARPFTTAVNALGENRYLRISPECALKRVLCGGINKVYELGKNFRNEGIDSSHNPEFTMVEWYEAYSDYIHQMTRVETLIARLCEEIHGTTQIVYCGRPLDLTPPWQRLSMTDSVSTAVGREFASIALDELPSVFETHHPAGLAALPAQLTWGEALVALFEALVEPQLWEPVFVIDHPLEISPLTKRHRRNPGLVERFEPMIAGMEIGNSYSELSDPVEQYERLIAQQGAREDAYQLDEDFVLAMAHGMPPAGGTGIGVDRLVMILTGRRSIRDVLLFPLTARQSAKPIAATTATDDNSLGEMPDRAGASTVG